MEVLKDGSVPDLESWEKDVHVVCHKFDRYDTDGCGAELKINFADLKMMHWEGTHSTNYYAAVQCPRCLKMTKVTLPPAVWNKFYTPLNKKTSVFDGFRDGSLT